MTVVMPDTSPLAMRLSLRAKRTLLDKQGLDLGEDEPQPVGRRRQGDVHFVVERPDEFLEQEECKRAGSAKLCVEIAKTCRCTFRNLSETRRPCPSGKTPRRTRSEEEHDEVIPDPPLVRIFPVDEQDPPIRPSQHVSGLKVAVAARQGDGPHRTRALHQSVHQREEPARGEIPRLLGQAPHAIAARGGQSVGMFSSVYRTCRGEEMGAQRLQRALLHLSRRLPRPESWQRRDGFQGLLQPGPIRGMAKYGDESVVVDVTANGGFAKVGRSSGIATGEHAASARAKVEHAYAAVAGDDEQVSGVRDRRVDPKSTSREPKRDTSGENRPCSVLEGSSRGARRVTKEVRKESAHFVARNALKARGEPSLDTPHLSLPDPGEDANLPSKLGRPSPCKRVSGSDPEDGVPTL